MGSITIVDALGQSSEERRKIKEATEALNAEARENWHKPEWRALMAAEVTEAIVEGFEHENLLAILTDAEEVDWEDRVTVSEMRGLKAHWVARGGYLEASTIRKDVMELERGLIGFHLYENEDKLRSGFAETQSNLINLGVQRLLSEVNLYVLRTMQAAIPSSSDYYISGAGLSLSALNTAIREVADETKDSSEITIVGRSSMTQQIVDELESAGNYTPETNERIVQLGVLGRYRGARIVQLKNHKDDEDVSFFPGNELYVVARDASKFAFWGGFEGREWTEDDADYWHYRTKREFGGIVHRPERVRRIVDTSIAA